MIRKQKVLLLYPSKAAYTTGPLLITNSPTRNSAQGFGQKCVRKVGAVIPNLVLRNTPFVKHKIYVL